MRKITSILVIMFAFSVLVACGNENENSAEEELFMLEVDFEVANHAEVGENVDLKATVKYGEEFVKDAHEVVFEVWEKGDQENSEMIDAENHDDGTYTATVKFDHDGIYEMYAHTTAKDQHTMPKKEIVIGEGGDYEEAEAHFHTEGFDMHFMEPNGIETGEEVELIVNLLMHEEPFEQAKVRYEIWSDDEEEHLWVETEEKGAGEYTGVHEFSNKGVYHIQIHVEDDNGLHEHREYEVEVE